MTKLTVVGDCHFQPSNLDKQRQLFAKIKELGNPVIFLGDLLHTKEIIRGSCLNALMYMIRDLNLRTYILVGNHDLFNLHSEEHSLESLKMLQNVTIFDKPSVGVENNVVMGFIPYIHELSKFRETAGEILANKPKILFLHQGITGFDYGNGFIEKNGIASEELSEIPMVVSGHFHKFQKEGNILYLGTPFSHDFGETDQKKYIAVLDLEKSDIQLIPTRMPEHRTFYVRTLEDLIQLEKMKKTDHNRIILCGEKEALSSADLRRFPAQILERYSQTGAKKQNEFFEKRGPEASFQYWAKSIKKFSDELVELGLEIIKE